MIRSISENLSRQSKAFTLLLLLLEEEYSRLTERNPQGVSKLEMTLQELMRQLAAERLSLKRLLQETFPGGTRLRDLPGLLGDNGGDETRESLEAIDALEQRCSQQAAKNQQLAMGLLDQSRGMLEFLHKKVQPQNTSAYSAKGRYAKAGSKPALLSGRL
jgi:hypothetical protein